MARCRPTPRAISVVPPQGAKERTPIEGVSMSDSRSAAPTSTGRGVSLERRFTEADKHPFDCVEWEIRDAVIGDAFEQRGGEFPKSWSQNATNIVAQKYFRGRMDSPERERSVRQMIGRVAGTIAAWGREGGYFATEDDAS